MVRTRQLRLPLRRKAVPRLRKRGRPAGADPAVRHRERERFVRWAPLHVRLRVRADVPNLRRPAIGFALRAAFTGGKAKPGFALCQFSIQGNHLHLVCEAGNHQALARGMQGLAIRAARAINRACRRRGAVFADRYRATRVTTPTQLRNTLCYVLHNARRHGTRVGGADPYSSARWFDGFSKTVAMDPSDGGDEAPVADARTHLLCQRWRWIGLIDPDETPPAAHRDK